MAIVWLKKGSMLSVGLSVCRSESSSAVAAEATLAPRLGSGSCHCLDSCHANTPATIIGALMGLSLTWEQREGGRHRGPRVC